MGGQKKGAGVETSVLCSLCSLLRQGSPSVLIISSASFGGLHPCGPSVQAWTEAERMLLPDRESVRRPSVPPRPGPLHAVLWAGPSPESTASICEFVTLMLIYHKG